jgi:type III secretory pathway component EscT
VAVFLGALAFPQLAPVVSAPTAPLLVLLLLRELVVGVTLGFLVSLTFRAAELAGRWIDVFRGATMAELLAPPSGERSSPTGALFLLLSVVIFLETGGLARLALALARSYEVLPLVPVATPAALGASAVASAARLVHVVVLVSAGMLEAALGLAAPVLVAVLLADVALGLVARFSPQVQVYFLGLPLKALAGTAVVLLSLGTLRLALVDGLAQLWVNLELVLASWRQ